MRFKSYRMKKILLTIVICCFTGIISLFAQGATQATIVFWDASQPDQVFDNVMNFKFNANQLLVELSDQSITAIDIADIRKITLASTSSIESYDLGQDIFIYPNPTSDRLHFASATEKELQVAVYSMNGQQLMHQMLTSSETLDVSSLPTGMYIIKINHFAYKFNKW